MSTGLLTFVTGEAVYIHNNPEFDPLIGPRVMVETIEAWGNIPFELISPEWGMVFTLDANFDYRMCRFMDKHLFSLCLR